MQICFAPKRPYSYIWCLGNNKEIKPLRRYGTEWLGAARVQIRDGRCEIWAVMLHVDVAPGSSYAKFYDIDVHVVAWLCLNWAVCCLIVSWIQGLAGHYRDAVLEVFHVNSFINIPIMFGCLKSNFYRKFWHKMIQEFLFSFHACYSLYIDIFIWLSNYQKFSLLRYVILCVKFLRNVIEHFWLRY